MTIDEFMRDIAPKMRPGYVAMNKDGRWFYFTYEPRIIGILWWGNDYETSLSMFDIAPVDEELIKEKMKINRARSFNGDEHIK